MKRDGPILLTAFPKSCPALQKAEGRAKSQPKTSESCSLSEPHFAAERIHQSTNHQEGQNPSRLCPVKERVTRATGEHGAHMLLPLCRKREASQTTKLFIKVRSKLTRIADRRPSTSSSGGEPHTSLSAFMCRDFMPLSFESSSQQ